MAPRGDSGRAVGLAVVAPCTCRAHTDETMAAKAAEAFRGMQLWSLEPLGSRSTLLRS